MGIFKFSDPMYMGSNVIVHQIQNFPYLLYIKLHLKMPGNEQLQISSPPSSGGDGGGVGGEDHVGNSLLQIWS